MTGIPDRLLALLTPTAAPAVLLWPLLRPASRRAMPLAQAANLSIYRDQFAELERDLAAGTLGPPTSTTGTRGARAAAAGRGERQPAAPASARRGRDVAWLQWSSALQCRCAPGCSTGISGSPQASAPPKHAALDPSSITSGSSRP